MALFAGATWNPAGATPGAYMDPRVVIFHVIAGEGNARPHDGLEWHFEVSYSGQVEQGVDTNRQAAANYKANPFAISIETEGLGDGEWTDAQLDALVDLSEWCLASHPKISRQRCPTWDGSGFGYHVMFGAPGPWTPVAKSCPGPNRIRQFDEVLLPRILNPQEDDMTDQERAMLTALWERIGAIDAMASGVEQLWARRGIIDSLANLNVGDDADEAEIVRGVLAGLNAAALSDAQVQAIVKAMPDAVKQALREGTG